METTTKRKVISVLILSVILLASMTLVTQTIGLSRGGFSETLVFDQWLFYAVPGGIFLTGVLLIYLIEYFIKKKDNLYGDGIGFSPAGEFPSLSYFKRFSNLQLFLLASIIFSILGTISFYTKQTAFTGIGYLPNQFTAIDSLVFSSFLVPAAENLGAAFLIAFTIFGIRYYARKNKISKNDFRSLVFIIVPVELGIYGVLNHLLRYSSQEQNLVNVFGFWFVGGVITVLIGSYVVFWVAHIFNNFIFDLGRFVSNESILTGMAVGILAMVALYWFLYIKRGKKPEAIT